MEDSRTNWKGLAEKIEKANFYEAVKTNLSTSERVLKRVTDGIYRLPASALRELISNAYDADATKVEVLTDFPRFEEIRIKDDGNGLSQEALAYLIKNIGGSAKRTEQGQELSVCNPSDRTTSPRGRKLIGKIGIGLFSVAQLTKEFQIITKQAGNPFRTVADVILGTYSEDGKIELDSETPSGEVVIQNIPADDIQSHGTEIVLRNLLPATKAELRSAKMWTRVDSQSEEFLNEISTLNLRSPSFHIGKVDSSNPNSYQEKGVLPWLDEENPKERFKSFVSKMWSLRATSVQNPSLHDHLDNYLRMLWILSLSAPIDYVEAHPFDLTARQDIRFFELGNLKSSMPEEISLTKGESVRSKLKLVSPERGTADTFSVVIDGVQLFRPIPFSIPSSLMTAPQATLMFIGKDTPDLGGISESVRGGPLSFEAYLYYSKVVVPKEHAGVLLRVNDSNGALFDSSFLGYPISELQRTKKVVAEVFVTQGLDAAQNIDRESFNYSHPHYQYITHWVHNAFRQLASTEKKISAEIREASRVQATEEHVNKIEETARQSIKEVDPDFSFEEKTVKITSSDEEARKSRESGDLAYSEAAVLNGVESNRRSVATEKKRQIKEAQIKALAKVLEGFGILESLSWPKQQKLLNAILRVFSVEE